MNKACTFLMVCLFVSLGGAVCVWGKGGGGEGGVRVVEGGRSGALAITSVDRLLSVFTQTRGVSQGVNILITAPTSWAVSEAEVPGLSGAGEEEEGVGGGRWGKKKKKKVNLLRVI